MFISEAYAAAEPALAANPTIGSTIVQLALILLIFYFLLIRPQQKRVREHVAMVEALKQGDEVVTNSGIYGTISKLEEKIVSLEVAPGVEIRIDRMSVSGVVEKPKAGAAKPVKAVQSAKTKEKKKK